MLDLSDNPTFHASFLQYMYEKKHVMQLYDDLDDYRMVASRFIADGLRGADRCIMATEEYTHALILSDLEALGVDTARCREAGRLILIDVAEHYSAEKGFDPDETMKGWQDFTTASVNDGIANVRAVGEATFSLQGEGTSDKLIYYENIINEKLFPDYPFMSLCVYNKNRYAPNVIKAAIQSHPMLVYGRKMFKHNIYYVAPEIFFSKSRAASEIDQWLDNMERSNDMVQQIVEKEDKLSTIFNASNDALFIHSLPEEDDRGAFLEVNAVASRLLGYTREELLGMTVADIEAKGRDRVDGILEILREHGELSFETRLRRRDGARLDVEINSRLFWLNGKRTVFSAARDTSRRKETERRLKQTLEATNDGIWEYNLREETFDCSPRWAEMLGYRQDEVSEFGCFCRENSHPDDRHRYQSAMNDYLEGRSRDYALELRLKTKDGSYKWIYTRGKVVERDDLGAPVRMVGAHTDITDRKQAEEAMRQSEEHFRILYNNAPVAYQSLDENGNFVEVNKTFCSTLGYDRHEMLGRNFAEFLHPDWREHFRSNFPRFKAVGEVMGVEFEMRKKSGDYILVSFNGRIGTKPDGSFRQTHCVFRDVTDERRRQKELVEAKERAEEASRTKSLFLANMSHELRTPLNGIMGMHQVLDSTDLDDRQRECLDMAVQSARRLAHLLGDIMDLTKIESGKLSILPQAFSLDDCLQQTGQLFVPPCRQKGIDIVLERESDVPDVLLGDAMRLQQVLNNLMGNAVKFTEEGEVRLSACRLSPAAHGATRVLFTVSDTGSGISDHQLESVFDTFTQADQSYTRMHQGAGLGLSIVRQVVLAMGGSIAVENREDGTAFHVCLPFEVGGTEVERAESCVSCAESGQRSGRILLVEDDRVNSIATGAMLKTAGYDVDVAWNGKEALEKLRGSDYDIVLMDIQMPVMDGLTATRAIRQGKAGETCANMPVIALTAYAMAEDRDRFITAGVSEYVSKPLEKEELLRVLGQVMEQNDVAVQYRAGAS